MSRIRYVGSLEAMPGAIPAARYFLEACSEYPDGKRLMREYGPRVSVEVFRDGGDVVVVQVGQPAPVDFTPQLRWYIPGEGEPNEGDLELLVTIADHTFCLAGIWWDEGYYWWEEGSESVGPNAVDLLVQDDTAPIGARVAELRTELPKWAALIPNVPAAIEAAWKLVIAKKGQQ